MFRKQFHQRHFLQAGETDNLQNLVQALRERVFHFGNGHQEVGADRCPDLDAHPVGVVAEEAAQTKVLLDPAEEQLDLPAPAIDGGDRECGQMESVRQEDEGEAAFRIEVSDTPKGLGIVLAALPEIEADRLVASDSAGLVDLPGLDDIEAQVALAADNEEGLRGVEPMQPLEIHVAAVDDIKAVRLNRNLVEGSDLVPTPFVKAGEDRNVCCEIEEHVELHGRMAALPPRPREKCQAQLDQRRIQSEQREGQVRLRWMIGVQSLRSPHQNGRHLREHVPVSLRVGISQIAALDLAPDAGVVKQLATRLQAGLDVAQALAIRQLRKNHRREMIERGDRRGAPPHRVTCRAPRKLDDGQAAQNLRQYCPSLVHRAKMTRMEPAKTVIENTPKSP